MTANQESQAKIRHGALNKCAYVLPVPRTARMSLTADVRAACGPPVAMMPEMISLYCLRTRSRAPALPVSLLAGAKHAAPRRVQQHSQDSLTSAR